MSDVKSQPNRWTYYGRRLFWPAFVYVAAFFVVVFVINQSQEFSHCIHNGKNTQEYNELKERSGVFIQPPEIYWLRFRLYVGCVGHFTDSNEAAIVAVATIFLSIFTFTLWRATDRLGDLATSQSSDMQELLIAARNNANAAAKQADTAAAQHATLQEQARATKSLAAAAAKSAHIAERALVELESPFVLVRITESGIPPVPRDPKWEGNFGRIRFVFSNYGRTPARIISDFSISAETDKEIMPLPIDLGDIEENFGPEGIVIPPNGLDSEEFDFSVLNNLMSLDPNKNELFFMGFVRYRDIFGNRYRSGFCFRLLASHRCFVVAGDDRYNYYRRETGSECLRR